MPVTWRWTSGATPRPVALELTAPNSVRTDTLRFDATGHAELSLPPGAYRYAAVGGSEHGLVVVEQYSDEWRPGPVTVVAQPGDPSGGRIVTEARERWWLFAIALAAFAAEWAWRRRQGLP